MKIKFTCLFAVLAVCFFPSYARAQITVVKQDGRKIYLDISEYNRRVSVGNTVKVVLSQEKLINPKTGKELGFVPHYSEPGQIIEVQDLYAVAQMPSATDFTGKEVLLESAAAPVVPALSSEKTSAAAPSDRRIEKYEALERELISAAQANLIGDAKEEIAAVDTDGNVLLYTRQGPVLREQSAYKLPIGYKPLALSVYDLQNTGRAQIFVTAYHTDKQKISTFVLNASESELQLQKTLPYFVKTLGCNEQQKLYAQKPFVRGVRAGEAHLLTTDEKGFILDKKSLDTRGNWLSGLNYYPFQQTEKENLIYTASNGTLRVRLQNGKQAESKALFGQTPNRVKYKQQLVSFYPSVQVYGSQEQVAVAAAENTAKWGLLSGHFGQYNGGQIHFLTYQNGRFLQDDVVTLDGFVYDISCTSRGILVPQVLADGQTVLAEIYR